MTTGDPQQPFATLAADFSALRQACRSAVRPKPSFCKRSERIHLATSNHEGDS
jgi:hypothetical protein